MPPPITATFRPRSGNCGGCGAGALTGAGGVADDGVLLAGRAFPRRRLVTVPGFHDMAANLRNSAGVASYAVRTRCTCRSTF